ncbi:predicted protein [Uncinocarpus reesii 1704]|uniref:Mso1 N-terminal domain-containing protein n=1 Tax=Uncinocarpus reesii (strain UAMH 1704) TaxID=336963 RepID=C4JR70_UNCRE|nr:uncharacterized protein UREG_03552 [Uncinocarpus reesii 1704]EEP78706.1 predicted protein [Uncinocarpus reesii 1704]
MSSYFSSFTTSTAISNISTRFTSLRRALSSGDETDDPDHEDNSHISHVLRAYYTEKGRRLPPWLPPDPKSSQPPPPAVATQTSFQGYGGQPSAPAGRGGGGRGGLGDLWGDTAPASAPAQPQTSSLRLGRGANAPASGLPGRPSPSGTPRHPFDRSQSARQPGSAGNVGSGGARPLPSQMAGSYQTSQAAQTRPGGPDRTLSAASAQERLRARLHGGSGGAGYGGGNMARKPLAGPR